MWKLSDPYGAAGRMMQTKVPASLSMLTAIGVGLLESFAGVLVIVPRFRRWGAWLTGFLLIAFMVYIGAQYAALKGADCTCFPLLKRAVGPVFFIGDAMMLVAALIAGYYSERTGTIRAAAIIFGALAVFAGLSYGVHTARQSGVEAPDTVTIEGKPESLKFGKAFIFFYDPQCLHCYEAAKKMSTAQWKETKVYAVPTATPEFARGFLKDTGFKAGLDTDPKDLDRLKEKFPFVAGPYAVLLENGRLKQAVKDFDGAEPIPTLKKLGAIE